MENIINGTYGKLLLHYFSFFSSADFSSYSFLKNAWGRFVYEKLRHRMPWKRPDKTHTNVRTRRQRVRITVFLLISALGTCQITT